MAVVTLAGSAQVAFAATFDLHSPISFGATAEISFGQAAALSGVFLLAGEAPIDFDAAGGGKVARKIARQAQSMQPGVRVELFEIDGGPIGATTLRFTAGNIGVETVVYDGNTYGATPVEATGFEWNGQGPFPTPRLRVANIANALSGLALAYDDLVGAEVRRIVTFRQYLDDGDDPDPTAHFPVEKYLVERKIAANKVFIEFQLSSAVDQEGRMLPRRQVLKDACLWRYRRYDANAGAFDYDDVVGCPYVGANYFDETGAVVTEASDDKCGKRLSDCKLRFGENAELPYGAFPGVTRANR